MFPLVPSDWGICASPPETDQDSCPGWLPPVPLVLVSPQGGFLPLDLSASLPPEFCPLLFVCVLCGTWHSTFMRNLCQLEEFINCDSIRISERYYSRFQEKARNYLLNLVVECQFLLEELLLSKHLAFYRVGKTTLEKVQ